MRMRSPDTWTRSWARGGGRQLEDGGGFHVRIVDPACASSHGTRSATLADMMIVIAHGASGRSSSMQSHVEGLAERGIAAQAIDLPLRRAEAAVPAYRRLPQRSPRRLRAWSSAASPTADAWRACWRRPTGARTPGSSASATRSIVPGPPDWEARTEHWPFLDLPVLLLSGEADPFARIDLLRRARGERLPRAELVTYPRVGHSLRPVLADALDHVVAFVRAIEGARGR